MSLPTLVITPSETRDRNGPVALTESGAVRRVPFDGGQAFFVEEGTTNLFINPVIKTTAYCSGSHQGVAVSHLTEQPEWVHGNAVRVTTIEGAVNSGLQAGSTSLPGFSGIAEGASIIAHADVKSTGNIRTWLRIFWVGGGATDSEQKVEEFDSGGMRRVITGSVVVGAGQVAAGASVMIRDDDSVVKAIDVSNVQIEEKPYATSFAHGDMGDGYSWEGAPHNSASVREDALISAAHPMPPDQGSWYIRYMIPEIIPRGQYVGGFGVIGGAGSKALQALVDSDGEGRLRQGQTIYITYANPAENTVQNVYAEYLPDEVTINFRGEGRHTYPRIGDPPPPTWHNDSVPVGYSGLHGSPGILNGYVAALIAYDRPLTEAQIARLDSTPTNELTWASAINALHPEYRPHPIPSLLLSPDESRDRNGPVEPTVSSGVQIVAGKYGQAWSRETFGGFSMPTTADMAPDDNFSMMIRARIRNRTMDSIYPLQMINNGEIRIAVQGGYYGLRAGYPHFWDVSTPYPGDDTWYVMAASMDNGVARAWLNGDLVLTRSYQGTVGSSRLFAMQQGSAGDYAWDIESILIFPSALTEEDIHRISTMPEAWTWESLMPQIGGVRTSHSPAPFAINTTHGGF